MNAKHWDDLAPRYADEVFNVLANDRRGLIAGAIADAGNPKGLASDLGCGPGRFLPLLAPHFRQVLAVDHSAQLLKHAAAACSAFPNIEYVRADLSKPASRLPQVDCALSVNALLSPSLDLRRKMLDFYGAHVRPGGRLLLVVPALESAHLSRQMLIEWNLRSGLTPSAALRQEQLPPSADEALQVRQGVLELGGVPTKHYLREELESVLPMRGFEVEAITKLEYPWTTEFESPPDWLGPPCPWDWLVQARQSVRRTRHTSGSRQRSRVRRPASAGRPATVSVR